MGVDRDESVVGRRYAVDGVRLRPTAVDTRRRRTRRNAGRESVGNLLCAVGVEVVSRRVRRVGCSNTVRGAERVHRTLDVVWCLDKTSERYVGHEGLTVQPG